MPVIIPVIICFQHLTGNGIYFIFVFHAISCELQFINSIIQLILAFTENSIGQSHLVQSQLPCLCGADPSLVIQIIGTHHHGNRGNTNLIYGFPNPIGNFFQKFSIGADRAIFQFYHDISGMTGQLIFKISTLMNLLYQFTDYLCTGFSLIVLILTDNRFTIVIQSLNFKDQTLLVVFYFNFGVDTQQKRTCGRNNLLLFNGFRLQRRF